MPDQIYRALPVSYIVLASTEDDYYEMLALYQGEIPETYRDFQIYHTKDFTDILHPQKGCYSIPSCRYPGDDQEIIARAFVDHLLSEPLPTLNFPPTEAK